MMHEIGSILARQTRRITPIIRRDPRATALAEQNSSTDAQRRGTIGTIVLMGPVLVRQKTVETAMAALQISQKGNDATYRPR